MRRRRRRAREADPVAEPFTIDDEVSHLTRIRSEPSQRTLGDFHACRKRAISTFGRESGRLGAGGFSRADCAYAAARKHLPTKGPWCVDDMASEAYVSQFSSDGSLLVAGFRGSRIRIYDADNGWEVHKDISCRSLQWAVSDIALSPDQQLLAYSSLSPTVHIVNVQSAGKEHKLMLLKFMMVWSSLMMTMMNILLEYFLLSFERMVRKLLLATAIDL